MKARNNTKTLIKDDPHRTSTQDIDDALLQLQVAYTDGRIDEKELDERTLRALNAKSHGELHQILSDLAPRTSAIATQAYEQPIHLDHFAHSSLAIFSGLEKKGEFLLPAAFKVTAVCGGLHLDLSEAIFAGSESYIKATAIMGGIEIIVPPRAKVIVNGFPILGGISQKLGKDKSLDDGPVIKIKALAILGGIEIKRAV